MSVKTGGFPFVVFCHFCFPCHSVLGNLTWTCYCPNHTPFCFAVDLSIGGVWSGAIEEQCEKMDEHHTPLSKQQLVQLIRSLILVEQVSI